ncbi:MAG: Hydrogenase maturation protease [Methanomicrobiales archaeon 53_19]|uniref:hydrogenase maturation peptidase HycI n=1 Tax=Methanocalculus sp. TaxID=2004547 RepID=UPI0007484628|nr:hydrogenase maturation peptidase HycI [Methanocalculus sp.]KUK70660.1 MAG: Hydrogenase maturation protease [Methanocalculus sp. 52_23]KUL03277.1 MAG: Hydrogenase maturation protease [Methanomicrobiales archaeon 53_19]HIJ07282.1 hydrogenase maturation peptidase HycI [Methanocalculus sp.]
MKVLLGVGNTLLSDDGVGCFIADRFDRFPSDNLSSDSFSSGGWRAFGWRAFGWRAFHGGTAPENFTAPIRRLEPEILVIVDAADMGLPPGSIRIIPPDQIDDTSIGTHMLPLSHLIHYLSSDIPEILFIGIQPETIGPGEGLSSAAETAAEALINVLKKGDYASLERL